MTADKDRTKADLIRELVELRAQVARLDPRGPGEDTTEAALRRSETALKSILHAAPVGVGLVVDRVLLQVNEFLCRMVGYTPEELVGHSARILYPSEEEYQFVGREKYRQIGESGSGTVQTRWRRKDGTVIDVLLSSSAIDPDDLLTGVTFTVLDITEANRAAEALRHRVEFERLITAISSQFMTYAPGEIDAGVNGALRAVGQFAEVDRSYVFLFSDDGTRMDNTHEWCDDGIEPQIQDLQGVVVSEVAWFRDRIGRHEVVHVPRVADLPPEAATEKHIFEMGEIQSLINVPMVHRGELIGFVGFDSVRSVKTWSADDVMLLRILGEILANALYRQRAEQQRTQLEEQLRHAQKMQAVGQLAGGIAHDFGNQLMVIKWAAEKLLRERLVSAEGIEDVRAVLEAAERSQVLAGDLLAFSRKGMLRPQVVDLSRMIADLGRSLPAMVGEDIRVAVSSEPAPCCANVDPGQLQHAVVNLALNARDAMPAGGELRIRVDHVELDAASADEYQGAKPGRYAVVVVSDTGTGMDEQTLAAIFDPFFTTKEPGRGTGLGLAMVHGFVAQSGGFIDVQSKPAAGSTFRLHFPCVEEPAPAPATTAGGAPQVPTGNETILVVEDEDAVRRMLVTFLRRAGYEVLEARDPGQALPLAEKHKGRLDMLVTDVVMPGMNGMDLAERIRGIMPDLPALFISGYAEGDLLRRGYRLDASTLLAKPFSQRDLAVHVRRLLDRPRRRP